MKQPYIFISILSLLIVSFIFTGFDCGSPALTSARLYIKNNDLQNAEKSIMTELDKNPQNAEAWNFLGDVRMQLKNFEGMVEAYDKSLKVSNEFADTIRSKKLAIWGTSINYAVDLYNKSTSAPKDSASLLRQQAIVNYQRAILVLPDSALPYRNIAITYHIERDFDNEILYLSKALQKKNDNDVLMDLINAYIRKAQNAKAAHNEAEVNEYNTKAIDAITAARKQDPNNQELLGVLINLYIDIGKAKDALPLIRESLAKDPTNKVYQNDMGLLLIQTEEYEEAIQHFEAAIATDEMFEDALWNCAVANMKYGEKMKKSAEAAADPKKKESTLNRAYVEKFKSAIGLAKKLIAIKPDEAKYWNGLGTASSFAGMAKEAKEAFAKEDALRAKK